MPSTYDAILIGAGHNALTTAAYLARVNGMKQQFARLAAAEPPTSPQWSRR